MAKNAAKQEKKTREVVMIDLALQGGGSHGAFTWGVLDRLLEEPWLKIEAISGTSAGAMNAAVLVSGHMQGGAEGARAALDAYWDRVAEAAKFSPIQRSPLDRLMDRWSLDTSPVYLAMDMMSRVVSPYSLNPFGHNPISKILSDSIDFAHLAEATIKLFITATNVHTGRGRVFRNAEITPDVLLASACLPTMFQAIEIDGEPYWDGGYVGQSDDYAAGSRKRRARRHPGPDQPAGTPRNAAHGERDPQPPQRDFLQCVADEGTAHDRAAAPGRRSGDRRRRALGADANASDHDRQACRLRRFLEAQRRVGLS